MNHNRAPEIIKEVLSIAPDAWLFGATLLGPIRSGKLVPWDRDVDLGYPSEKVNESLIQKFRDAGFAVSGVYRLDMAEMIQYVGTLGQYGKFILKKDDVKVEMCCFTQGVGRRWYYASGTPRFFVLDDAMVYPQKKIRIYDFEVNVPVNAEDQLAFVYGKDWRKPREIWYRTADHYLRREHTIIELRGDDGTQWSKWTGRKIIAQNYGPQVFPEDINTPFNL